MITFNTKNLFAIDNAHSFNEEEFKSYESKIPEFLKKIKTRNQGFYTVIDDDSVIKKIATFKENVHGKYDEIVVLGIGGSALGMTCLQQSLKHLFNKDSNNPHLYVIDNIDPSLLRDLEDVISYDRTLFIVISKSGGTPETLSQFFYYKKQIEDKNLNVADHFVFITDPKKGFLRELSNKEGLPAFDVPENVGGRFSVLTDVGLLPAALIGIDIEKLVQGARKMRDQFFSESIEENLSFQLATMQYLLEKKGKKTTVLMPYAQRLIRFADWYRQLLAESIGKAKNEKGEMVHVGLTPVNALGVTDQHSQNQLYNEGPNDKFFVIIDVKNLLPKIEIPNLYPDNESIRYLNNVTFDTLMHTEQEGTIQSLTQNDRPNITLTINEIDESTLGELFMLFECSIAFLGEFFEINAFDQPGVELSKKITKELLLKN